MLVEEVEGLRGPEEVGTGGFLGMVLAVEEEEEEGTEERVAEMEGVWTAPVPVVVVGGTFLKAAVERVEVAARRGRGAAVVECVAEEVEKVAETEVEEEEEGRGFFSAPIPTPKFSFAAVPLVVLDVVVAAVVPVVVVGL